MERKKYCIALSHFPKFGPVKFKKIEKYFSEWKDAFFAPVNELMQAGIERNVAEEFIAWRNGINPDEIISAMEKENIQALTIHDELYPSLLKQIYNPPHVLYYRGKINFKNDFAVAVVGTRKYTNYGERAASEIARELAENGVTVVSGLALGIDAIAHHATLEAGGRTIAVLGSGLDKQSIYPASNRSLAERMVKSESALISEFAPGTEPLKHHFPQRNRIIAGLTLGTLVIEAGEKSGALITAYLALEQNREVFSLPGSIYSPMSAGPNKLLKQGARPVTNAGDILEALNLNHAADEIQAREIIGETEEEKKIISYLSREALHVDELVRLTKLDTSTINSTLTIMEIKGMVKNLGGMQYVLAR